MVKVSPWGAVEKAIIVIVVILVTAILTIAVHCIVYAILNSAPQENTTRVNETVKAICDWSRDMQSGAAEEACGIAQDKSMTEYMCPSYDAPNIKCWIEDKR